MQKVQVTKENISFLITCWDACDSEEEVYEFIGITKEQYDHWVKTNELIL